MLAVEAAGAPPQTPLVLSSPPAGAREVPSTQYGDSFLLHYPYGSASKPEGFFSGAVETCSACCAG